MEDTHRGPSPLRMIRVLARTPPVSKNTDPLSTATLYTYNIWKRKKNYLFRMFQKRTQLLRATGAGGEPCSQRKPPQEPNWELCGEREEEVRQPRPVTVCDALADRDAGWFCKPRSSRQALHTGLGKARAGAALSHREATVCSRRGKCLTLI